MKNYRMNFFGIFLLFLGLLFINNCSTSKLSEPKQKPDAGKDVKTDGAPDVETPIDVKPDAELPDVKPDAEPDAEPDVGPDIEPDAEPDVPPPDQLPTIQLNFNDGDVITEESVEIIASAFDDKGISKVKIFIDEEKVAAKTEAPYSYIWDVSQKFDGTYYLKVIAYDTADQIATDEARVIVRIPDRPEIAIINPTKNSDVCGLITIEAAVTVAPNRTVAVVEFFIDDKFLSNDKSGPTYTADWDTKNFSNQEHKIKAIITDSANAKAKDEIAAKVDNAAGRCDNLPSIVIEQPKTDTFINARANDDITIKARASDDFGVIKVQFFIDNGMIGEDNSTPYSISWNIDDFDEGPHTIKAVAYDTANQFAAMTIQVTLDRTAPSVKILSPSDNQHFGGDDGEIVPIKVEAIDNFGIKEVILTGDYETLVVLNAPPYEFNWDLTDVESGEHTIRAVATDFAGIDVDEEISILLDRPPTVAFISPQDGDKIWGTIEIAVALNDDLTAKERLFDGFQIDGQDFSRKIGRKEWEGNVLKIPFDTTYVSFGEHTMQLTAEDGYDQKSFASVRVTVDQPLEAKIINPTENSEIYEEITVKAEVKDDNPITKVEFYCDNVFQGLMTGNPRQYVFNTMTWPDGAHKFRVTAYNDLNQTAEAKRNVTINNCDRDHDAHLSEICGGDDCDDKDNTIYPGEPYLLSGSVTGENLENYPLLGGVNNKSTPSPIIINDAPLDARVSKININFSFCSDDSVGATVHLMHPDGTEVYVYDLWVGRRCSEPITVEGITRFNGKLINGEWQLYIDGRTGDTGYLDYWQITIFYSQAHRELVGDGIDQNCDGVDGIDSDRDGFASVESWGDDCDDTRPDVFPGAPDNVGNGVDNNCDGVDGIDSDMDRHASISSGGDDCDDTNSKIYPTVPDIVGNDTDDNCDGIDGVDNDKDGYASIASGGNDCDDARPDVFPGAPDSVGNGIDNNCDGIDGVDDDRDGFASIGSGGSDCDDTNPLINPPAMELCDGIDNDCNGQTEEGFIDADQDGFHICDNDCNDNNPAVNPAVFEICGNGIDDNCDGQNNDCGTKKWEFVTSGGIDASPAIGSDGTIYVGPSDGRLYAINPNGTKKWEFVTGGLDTSPSIGGDETIYVGSWDQRLYAINPNGTKKWEFFIGWPSGMDSSPSIGSDGTIYVGSYNNKLYAINPNGTKKWEFLAGDNVTSSPAIGSDGTIYVGSDDNKLYAINPNGTKKWEFVTGKGIDSSPAIGGDGTIYVGSWDNSLYAINPNGTKKWKFFSGWPSGIASSPAIGSDGAIYISPDFRLYAITPDGIEKWEFPTGNLIHSSSSIGSDRTIYVGSDDGKLHAINPDGTKKWEFVTTGKITSSPAISSDGIIYVGSNDKKLYAIYSSSFGLVNSSWPKFHHDNRNTGNVSTPICQGDKVDNDKDGYNSMGSCGDDCDDTRADVFPGAPDTVGNNIDNNCDGIDGIDQDRDKHASIASGGDDCDDTRADVFPGAAEKIGDGIDQNCNGIIDEASTGDTCSNPFTAVVGQVIEGTTAGFINDYENIGCFSWGMHGPDVVYRLTLQETKDITITVTPLGEWDIGVYVLTDCADPANSCLAGADDGFNGDAEILTFRGNAGINYFVVVDGWESEGKYTLKITF